MVESVRQVRDQGIAHGVRRGPAFQPDGDSRCEAVHVPGGEQQPGIVTTQPGQEVTGGGVVRRGAGAGEPGRWGRWGLWGRCVLW